MITTALILVLSAAGCGKQNADTGTTTGAGETTDVSGAYEGTSADLENAVVDMEKIEGTEASSDNAKEEYDGSLGDYDVSIEDAKMIKADDTDIVVISFDYKNNSDKAMSFTGAFEVNVTQEGRSLVGAVVSNVEGLNLLTMGENIPSGDKVTVQRAYRVKDTSTPVTVEVKEFGSIDGDVLTKTFNF